ncbi:FRG domain-containing protein [bacterium RCC_150]
MKETNSKGKETAEDPAVTDGDASRQREYMDKLGTSTGDSTVGEAMMASGVNNLANYPGVAAAIKAMAQQAAGVNNLANNPGVAATVKAMAQQAAGVNNLANNPGVAATLKAISQQAAGVNNLANNPGFAQVLETLRLQSGNLSAARALGYKPLKGTDAKAATVYSREMTSHSAYFEQWELELDSFEDFLGAVTRLSELHPEFTFLWRGQRDASWPLHSSLFRALWKAKGVRSPGENHRSSEPFPTEEDMVRAEASILAFVRQDWRFEDLGAMSTFARLQHFGAPTRLLDVSRNPLIAAWFATEESAETEDNDCRIFALATGTLPGTDLEMSTQALSSRVDSTEAASPDPFWQLLENDKVRAEYEWGTGRVRRFWIPPLYESRIAAQNAGFVLDGVPLSSPDLDQHFHRTGDQIPWTYGDRIASASITARFSKPNRRVGQRIATALPPSFTFRVSARAKQEIRKVLNDRFSYNYATIYPDIQGAAIAISARLRELFKDDKKDGA